MWTFKKKIMFACYKAFASWLPKSQRSKFAMKMRGFFARRILKSCGKNVNIDRNAYFTPDVSLGDYSGIGEKAEIYGPVTIGNHVMMAPEVVCYTKNHKHDRLDLPMDQQGYDELKPIIIGNDVWIGRRVMLMPGVKIGNGVVIGAGGGLFLKISLITA